jgi:hypothetical protein
MNEYLGVLFERRDEGEFLLSQRQNFLDVPQRFGMEDYKPCATQCVAKKTVDEESTDMNYTSFAYREVVGSLLYLSTVMRPDISFTVGMLSHAMAAPSARNVVAVKRLIRYLSGTRNYGLVLGGPGYSTLVAYSDANWGGDIDRKSTSGALHFVGYYLVHWTRKKHGCVSFSTAEAEYVASSSCAQDVVWLRGVLFYLNFQQTAPTFIFEDNTAAVKWSSGGSRRAKHIDLNDFIVNKAVSMKHLILKYLLTAEQLSVSECPAAYRCNEHGGRINVIRVKCTVARVPRFGGSGHLINRNVN